LIEVFLEAGEDFADVLGPAQLRDGVGNGVIVFEL
jgi:hypothetical protein